MNKIVIPVVMLNIEIEAVFNYSGDNKQWVYVIGFHSDFCTLSEIKFTVLKNGEPAGICETEMTNIEKFIKIPFKANNGDDISLQVMNMTCTNDVVITHKSISML